jgi:hypothetical protein
MSQATLFADRKDRIELIDGRIVLANAASWTENGKKLPPRVAQFYNPHRGTGYVVRSALHKEVRRGDVQRALAFAAWAERIKSGSSRVYARKILFEETRNVRILQMFLDKIPTRDIIAAMCRSAKDWEVDAGYGICFPKWYEMCARHNWYGEYYKTRSDFPWPDDAAQYMSDAIEAGDHDKMIELAVMTAGPDLPRSKETQADIRPVLAKAAAKVVNPKFHDAVLSLRTRKHHEEVLLLAQIISGDWDEDKSNHLKPYVPAPRMDVPL